jgi:hypothetical protein
MEETSNTRWWLKWLGIVTGLFTLFACFFLFFINAHAIPMSKYDKIKEGMTESEVKALVGAPVRVGHWYSDTTTFGYGGFLRGRFCTMDIHFGTNGCVTGKFHDH